MASGPQTFGIVSVFSSERFKGNPLAIVSVRGNAITQQRKSLIAKEFGYSETVFVHDAPAPNLPRRIEIFTETGEEVPFAGHPIIGVTHWIFQRCERFVAPPGGGKGENERQTAVLMTKAGPVPVFYNPFRQVAACAVPHDLHVHADRIEMSRIIAKQPQVQIVPNYEKLKDKTFPVVSGVKGMTFALIDLNDAPEVLGALKQGDAPDYKLDSEWAPSYKGALYYKNLGSMNQENEPTIHAIQARMITQGKEDPGTGSASCILACYLATGETKDLEPKVKQETNVEELAKKTEEIKLDNKQSPRVKKERRVYAIQQGLEMGRPCTIAIEVDLVVEENGSKRIANVTLSGRANFFAEGQLAPHP